MSLKGGRFWMLINSLILLSATNYGLQTNFLNVDYYSLAIKDHEF